MGHDVHDHDHPHDHEHDHADHRVPDGHRATAPAQVAAFAITCSDTRSEKTDQSGRAIREGLEHAGHTLVGQVVIKDEVAALKQAIDQALAAATSRPGSTSSAAAPAPPCTASRCR